MWLKVPRKFRALSLGGFLTVFAGLALPAFSQPLDSSSTAASQWQTHILAPSTNSTEASPRTWDAKWSFGAAGRSVSEGTDSENQIANQQVFDSALNLGVNYWMTNEFFFTFEPTLRFQSGRVQALDDAGKTSNTISIRQAAVKWLPSNYVWLAAGALNEGEIHSSLVSDDLPFPGARATLKAHPQDWELSLTGESSIPSSNSLQTNTTHVEAVPVKNTLQGQVLWQPKPYLSVKNRLSYYSFQNLPSEVADASSLLGNTTTRINEVESAFTYKYQGVEATSDWQLPLLKKVDWLIQAAAAQNQAAPVGINTGYSAYSGFRYLMNSRHDFTVGGRYFRVEPDVAPAFYSNQANFRTNRVGYSAEAKWHLKKEKFTISTAYTEAQVIYQDPAQSRLRGVEIRLETDYDSL